MIKISSLIILVLLINDISAALNTNLYITQIYSGVLALELSYTNF